MFFPTTARLPFRQSHLSESLPHTLLPIQNTQARLAGRWALTPDINLDRYRFRAVIDWVEVKLCFDRVTQVQRIHALTRDLLAQTCFVQPANLGPGNTFNSCRIRVQQPESLALVANAVQLLHDHFGKTAEAMISAMEVSIDAYPENQTQQARWLLLGAIQRTFWTGRDVWSSKFDRPRTHPSDRAGPFLSPSPNETCDELSAATSDLHRAPSLDSTLYVGRENGDVMHRIMEKTLDRQHPSGAREELAEDQKRIRIEVTLNSWELEAIGVTDMASLRTFRPSQLQKRYFQFRLPTFEQNRLSTALGAGKAFQEKLRAETYLKAGINALGLMDETLKARRLEIWNKTAESHSQTGAERPKRSRGVRLAAPTVSWSEMNRKVNVALQLLEKRERKAWDRRGQ